MKSFSKRITALTASCALLLSVPTLSSLAAGAPSAELVPIRQAAGKMGASVSWNPKVNTVTITKGNTKLVLFLNGTKAMLNGIPVELKEPAGAFQVANHQTKISMSWIQSIFQNSNQGTSKEVDQFLNYLKSGDGAKAAQLMSPALKEALPVQTLNQMWGSLERTYGKVTGKLTKVEKDNAVHHNVTYTIPAAAAPVNLTIRLNHEGQVDDVYLEAALPPLYQRPAYDEPAKYTEQEVTVGSGTFALPGTLTKPVGEGPFPVVVLVQGSGPSDRDSSIYGAKPLRDLAVGLAAKGIATLRYDKVTYEHNFKVGAEPKFTLKDESVNDAISAVKLLKQTPGIDGSRIFVAGHSQGGYAMPLIIQADADKNIAGTILLAGPSSRMIDVAVEQQEGLKDRLKQLGQDPSPLDPQINTWKQVAKIIDDPQYSVDHLPTNFPMPPAYWWYEQRDYKPTDLAKKQSGPMLVLQGENDWQVPISEFNTWKSELKDRKDVEYKSYPKVNHMLAEVNVLSTGNEYIQPSNVASSIIDDIAAWIKKIK